MKTTTLAERAYVERDGVLIDPETGEIVGVYDPFADYNAAMDDTSYRFAVDTLPKLDWVLERMLNVEERLIGRRWKREQLIVNLDALDDEDKRELARLHARFDAEIETFARSHLRGGVKTLKATYGRVSFRVVRAAHRIVDMDLAIRWAQEHCPGIIRTTVSVPVTDLREAWDHVYQEDDPPHGEPAFIETLGGGERMSINLGSGS